MSILEQLNNELADVVSGVQRSLVHVHNHGQTRWKRRRVRFSGGAGVIAREDGVILTNAHVVRSDDISVTLPNGETVPARFLARAEGYDLAAIKVDADDLPAASFGDSAALRSGDWVTAVGHPWGIDGAATSGIVIGAGSELPEMPRGSREWVATSLHLRPGNSGGPLVDINGNIIGINTVMAGPEVGLAIPSNASVEFLAQL